MNSYTIIEILILSVSFDAIYLNEINCTIMLLQFFFDFFWSYDLPMRWALSIFFSTSSIPAFTNKSTILKTSSLFSLDTSGIPSILVHKRRPYCSNSSISFYSLTFACYNSKIWFWNIIPRPWWGSFSST